MKPGLVTGSDLHFRGYYWSEELVFTSKNVVTFKKTNLFFFFSAVRISIFPISGWFIFLSAATCRHILRKKRGKLRKGKHTVLFLKCKTK